MKSPVRPSRIRQIERTMAAMMSTITAPRHGASRLGPVIPIVMAEMIAEAGAAFALGTSLVLVAARLSVTAVQTDLETERARMVTTTEAHAEQVSTTLDRNYIAPQVLKAVSAVPRHEFVSDLLRGDAYADRPLPIGYGQTISHRRRSHDRPCSRS